MPWRPCLGWRFVVGICLITALGGEIRLSLAASTICLSRVLPLYDGGNPCRKRSSLCQQISPITLGRVLRMPKTRAVRLHSAPRYQGGQTGACDPGSQAATCNASFPSPRHATAMTGRWHADARNACRDSRHASVTGMIGPSPPVHWPVSLLWLSWAGCPCTPCVRAHAMAVGGLVFRERLPVPTPSRAPRCPAPGRRSRACLHTLGSGGQVSGAANTLP